MTVKNLTVLLTICLIYHKEKRFIQLECPDPAPPKKNVHLHIFEQLLMIYVGGLKHLWSDSERKVDLTKLTEENIQLPVPVFESINYEVNIEVFDLFTYQFKFVTILKIRKKITDAIMLNENFLHNPRV